MTAAAPPAWVRMLPEHVSTASMDLAHAEIERRSSELAKGGIVPAMRLAGTMALAQAYERIAQLDPISTEPRCEALCHNGSACTSTGRWQRDGHLVCGQHQFNSKGWRPQL